MKNSKLWGILSIVLVFGLVFMACPSEPTGVADAATPEITTQPKNGNFVVGQTITAPLSVVATVSDGGTLTYQWFRNATNANSGGTEIPGAINETYPPDTAAAATFYCYVVVTNTNNNAINKKQVSVTSNAVRVVITDPAAAEVPAILSQPQGGSFYRGDTVILKVIADDVVSGTLSYQWYSNTSATITGGTAISEAASATYPLPGTITGADGSYHYYVIVTNTAAGKTPSIVTSNVATVVINQQNPFATLTPNITLTVSNATKGQFIRGVGGMSDQCFIYGNGSWTDRVTPNDIQNMFGKGPQELGLNMYRLLMYPYLEEAPYNYTGPQGPLTTGDPSQGIVDDTTLYQPGPSGGSKNGTTAQDQSQYYEIIKKINAMGGYVMICPWTLPLQFTKNSTSGSNLGNGIASGTVIDPAKYEDLADWYISYLKNLVDHGAPVFALSPQNEPDQNVAYDGCRWSGDQQRDFYRVLGPKLEASGIKGYGGGRVWDKIWLATGDNAGLPGTLGTSVLNDDGASGASQYVEIAARHLYGGMGPYTAGINTIKNPVAGRGLKEIWETEHCDTTNRAGAGATMYNQMGAWSWVWHIANEAYNTFALNYESAFIWWTSKRFYGYIGEGEYGNSNGQVLARGHVMAHFGKYVLNTNMISVTATGDFVSNAGTNAGTGALTGTTIPVVVGTNLNPSAFDNGNSDTGGQNQPTTKVMAFEADDGSYISVVAFTATRNSGAGGQDAGYIRIDLPAGFVAASAELMRSTENVKQQIEAVPMNSARTSAIIQLPRSEIVSVKFIKQ